MPYNPNYNGFFDGVIHNGETILAHGFSGYGFQRTAQIGDWRDYDRKYGRGNAIQEMEFEAVRVENSFRNAIDVPLRKIYTQQIPRSVPQHDKYIK